MVFVAFCGEAGFFCNLFIVLCGEYDVSCCLVDNHGECTTEC